MKFEEKCAEFYTRYVELLLDFKRENVPVKACFKLRGRLVDYPQFLPCNIDHYEIACGIVEGVPAFYGDALFTLEGGIPIDWTKFERYRVVKLIRGQWCWGFRVEDMKLIDLGTEVAVLAGDIRELLNARVVKFLKKTGRHIDKVEFRTSKDTGNIVGIGIEVIGVENE